MNSDPVKLRKYQSDALLAVYGAWGRGVTRPAVVMATGLGKTVIFSHLIAQWIVHNQGKVLVLVHRDELATQARDKIQAVSGERVGIVKASQNDIDARIIVASVQTLASERRRDALRGIGLIIADECHHAAAKTWKAVLGHFGAWDGVPAVGFTATMHREDKKGLGEIWEEVVITRDIMWGVRNGFLVRPRGLRIRIPELHLEDKKLIVAGEYQRERVGQAMINADTGPAIARAVEQYALGMRMVTFAPNVMAAEHFKEHLEPLGGAEIITGKTPKHARLAAYARFQSGHTLHLVNAMVLTEGWDAPWCDGAVIARPTKNPGLFQQMVGRTIRPHGDKTEALIIDVAGATDVNGLTSLADLGFDPPEIKAPRKDPIDLGEDELLDDLEEDPYYIPEEFDQAPVEEVHAQEVDWFGEKNKYPWLKTRTGIQFLAGDTDIVFLWPNADRFQVGSVPRNRAEVAMPLSGDETLDEARKIAEKAIDELGYTSRTQKWRESPPSRGMILRLARMDVSVPESLNSGQVQDMTDIIAAERKLGG